MSTIQADMGGAMADGHINVTVQVRQVLAFEIKLVMASDKIPDDVCGNCVRSKVRRQMARPTGSVMSCTTMGNQRMSAADEIGMVGTARHRRAVRRNVISKMRARTAGIHQCVMTRTKINRIVPGTLMRLTTVMSTKSLAALTAAGTGDMAVIRIPAAVAEASRSMVMAQSGAYRATPVLFLMAVPIHVKTVMLGTAAARHRSVAHFNTPYSFLKLTALSQTRLPYCS
jgi:hypothetical protein